MNSFIYMSLKAYSHTRTCLCFFFVVCFCLDISSTAVRFGTIPRFSLYNVGMLDGSTLSQAGLLSSLHCLIV